jgi:hypothetical protein
VWWAREELNLRPLPCQQTAGKRCATRRSCRSPPTVHAEVMRSLGGSSSRRPVAMISGAASVAPTMQVRGWGRGRCSAAAWSVAVRNAAEVGPQVTCGHGCSAAACSSSFHGSMTPCRSHRSESLVIWDPGQLGSSSCSFDTSAARNRSRRVRPSLGSPSLQLAGPSASQDESSESADNSRRVAQSHPADPGGGLVGRR